MRRRDQAERIVDRILNDMNARPFLSRPWREADEGTREHIRRIWVNRARKVLAEPARSEAAIGILGPGVKL